MFLLPMVRSLYTVYIMNKKVFSGTEIYNIYQKEEFIFISYIYHTDEIKI